MENILRKIIKNKEKEVRRNKKYVPIDESNVKPLLPVRDFKKAISKTNRINLIAEVKKASPSAGVIRKDFDPVDIARQYEVAGASAISVLTDKDYFKGNLSYIKDIKKEVDVPILRKDFIIDEYQIYESVLKGADEVLLISDILSLDKIKKYLSIAEKYAMCCLIESHTEESIKKSIEAGAEIIGINNRNLGTFQVDIKNTGRLVKIVPDNKIIVSESGIKDCTDINYLESLNVDAVLIGETLMRADDIADTVKDIMK